MEIKLRIDGYDDRKLLTAVLAENGVRVHCIKEDDPAHYGRKVYFIVFDYSPVNDIQQTKHAHRPIPDSQIKRVESCANCAEITTCDEYYKLTGGKCGRYKPA